MHAEGRAEPVGRHGPLLGAFDGLQWHDTETELVAEVLDFQGGEPRDDIVVVAVRVA